MNDTDSPRQWLGAFDPRQQKQIAFAENYVRDFNHGADGHNSMQVIAKMAAALTESEDRVRRLLNFLAASGIPFEF